MVTQIQELIKLNEIMARVNSGTQLTEVLDGIFSEFRDIIPYSRIGFSLIHDDGKFITAKWARSDSTHIMIPVGYSIKLNLTSLPKVLETNKPRILNNLEEYLKEHPHSEPTKLIVEEGMRSSLTCPLRVRGVPTGVIFFASMTPHAYENVHVEIFENIAALISSSIEKARLFSDIAEKEKLLTERNAQLEALNEQKNVFLGMAAHDLRGPLIDVSWVSELMCDSSDSFTTEEKLEFAGVCQRSCEHMLGLIDDLLDVSAIESGKLLLNLESVDLDIILKESVAQYERIASRKQIAICASCASSAIIYCDKKRLRQVIDNLISNAIKYSPQNSTVNIYAEEAQTAWTVYVQDQGPGLTQEDQARLFQDFQRLSARPTAGEKSVGLGLAIARRIVTAHNGQIGVDSKAGQGARFWFSVPKSYP